MSSSLIQPTPITVPFAASGNKRTIPTTSQIGVTDGRASYPDGYPPLCSTRTTLGGKPPSILDENGILYDITVNLRYLLGGGVPKFSATMATAIGGYPLGAILQDNAGENQYQSAVDGNSVNFNTTPSAIGDSWLLVSGVDFAADTLETATTEETQTGTSTTLAVTPAGGAATYAPKTIDEDDIGSYCWAKGGPAVFGATIAGSLLTPAGADDYSGDYVNFVNSGTTLPGTWRCQGHSSGVSCVTLWKRIA